MKNEAKERTLIKNTDLAKELDLSYQAIVKKLNNPGNNDALNPFLAYNDKGQIIGIYDDGLEVLKNLKRNNREKIKKMSSEYDASVREKNREIELLQARIDEQSKTIEMLKDQINKKDDQMTEYKNMASNMAELYTTTINELKQQNLLLTNDLEQLQSQARKDDAINPEEIQQAQEQPEKKKKSFWASLFGWD